MVITHYSLLITHYSEYKHPANPKLDGSESYSEISRESNEGEDDQEETSYPGSKRRIIRQHKFYIHSAWLAVQSSYFRSLFFSGMKESNAKEVHVQISTNEEQAHLMLLEAMYKIDTLNKASVDELLEVLILAHKYDVKFAFKKCKYCLQDAVDSLETCEQIMQYIKVDNTITDVEDLASTLQPFLAKEFSPLDQTWQTTSFKELCEPSLKYLLSSDELVTVSENTVFHALMYWIEERGIENVLESQELSSLLSVVRFEWIPVDYLYNVVQHNSLAKKLMDFNDHYLRGISYHALSDTMKERLPHQSVKRRAETQPFVPFTWVIPTHKLSNAAFSLTDKTLKSEEFWYCGYEMRLVISDIVKDRDLQETYAMFMAKLSLEICNLTEESEVSIQWQPTSQCFKSTPHEQTHTFHKKTSLSSVDIKYRIKVPPLGIIPADVPLNQSGSFTSSATSATTQSVFACPPTSPESDNQTGFMFGTAPTNSGTNFGGGRVSDKQTGFTFGTAPINSGTNFGGGRVSDSQTGFTFGTPSNKSSTSISGFRVPGSQTGFTLGAATSESSYNFGEKRVYHPVSVGSAKP